MKIGIYFAYWETEWAGDYSAYCKKVAQLGFDVLEVAAGNLCEMSDNELVQLKTAALDNGIELSACIGLPSEYDVSSTDDVVRANGIKYMKSIITAMEKAGIKKLGGIVYAAWPADYSKTIDRDTAVKHSIVSVREIADFAKKHDVAINLEVVNRFEQYILNDTRQGIEFCKAVNRDNVKLLLDCFHMNIEEDNIGDAIRSAADYLGHYHVGETNRRVPGKGRMPWDEIITALKDIEYNGYIVMEPFVKTEGTVGKDIKVFRAMEQRVNASSLDKDAKEALEFLRKVING